MASYNLVLKVGREKFFFSPHRIGAHKKNFQIIARKEDKIGKSCRSNVIINVSYIFIHVQITAPLGVVLKEIKENRGKYQELGENVLSIGLLAIIFTKPFPDIPGTANHVEGHY